MQEAKDVFLDRLRANATGAERKRENEEISRLDADAVARDVNTVEFRIASCAAAQALGELEGLDVVELVYRVVALRRLWRRAEGRVESEPFPNDVTITGFSCKPR